ncbi:MAG TPA: MgtC/SapB family protein [Nitrospiraceae bacterium]|nr:MgtC/SapB family protein [Nitrospiraceae bacterium]
MTLLDFTCRIVLAVALGAVIGIERQYRQRGAGLRTNALVAMGAAAFVTLSSLLSGEQSPTRIAAQIVSGIGFIGGGVILREGLSIRGLNTAATLWCSAAVGSLAGSGFLGAAAITASVIVTTNVLLRPVGQLINRQSMEVSELEVTYHLTTTCQDTEEPHIRMLILQAVAREALLLKALRSEALPEAEVTKVQAEVVTNGRQDRLIEELTSRLSMEPSVRSVSWESGEQNGKDHA